MEKKKKKEAKAKKRGKMREKRRRREEERKKIKARKMKQEAVREGNKGSKKGVEKWARIGGGSKRWWRRRRKGETEEKEKWWKSRESSKGKGIIMRVAKWVAEKVGWKWCGEFPKLVLGNSPQWETGMRTKLMKYGNKVRMLKEREGGSRMGFEYGTKWGWKMRLDKARDLVEYTEEAGKSGKEWIGEGKEGTARQKKDRREMRERGK